MAPQVGFEPTTDRLTADCSTTELLWNIHISLGTELLVIPHTIARRVASIFGDAALLATRSIFGRCIARCSTTELLWNNVRRN